MTIVVAGRRLCMTPPTEQVLARMTPTAGGEQGIQIQPRPSVRRQRPFSKNSAYFLRMRCGGMNGCFASAPGLKVSHFSCFGTHLAQGLKAKFSADMGPRANPPASGRPKSARASCAGGGPRRRRCATGPRARRSLLSAGRAAHSSRRTMRGSATRLRTRLRSAASRTC